jgi:hypothetical protein
VVKRLWKKKRRDKNLKLSIGQRNPTERNGKETQVHKPRHSRCFRETIIRYIQHFPISYDFLNHTFIVT